MKHTMVSMKKSGIAGNWYQEEKRKNSETKRVMVIVRTQNNKKIP